MEFHECLNKIMKEKGVNQAQLCKLSGIATSAMSHYVRGETEPSFSKVIAISRALGVSVDVLAGRSGGDNPSRNEAELVDSFRRCTVFQQNAILHTAKAVSEDETLVPTFFAITDADGNHLTAAYLATLKDGDIGRNTLTIKLGDQLFGAE